MGDRSHTVERRKALGLLVAGAAVVLTGCGAVDTDQFAFFYPPYHFRLSVEVDTPEGIKVGSSVIEVKWSHSSFKVRGESVAVDLPNGETLFALLRSHDSPDWAGHSVYWIPEDIRQSWVMPETEGRRSSVERGEYFWRNVASYRGTFDVPRTRKLPSGETNTYPLLVHFRDKSDPASVEEVDPGSIEKIFGSGYRLRRVTATFTGDPVTEGISERLPWLSDYDRRDARLNGNTSIAISTNDLSDNLGAGSFRTGFAE